MELLLLLFFLHRGDDIHGYTDWESGDTAPYGWVRADVLMEDPSYGFVVAAHELEHVRQMREEADNFVDSYHLQLEGGPERLRRMEGEAYCASSREAVRRGLFRRLDDAVLHHAVVLSAGYPLLDLTRREAERLIWKFCV